MRKHIVMTWNEWPLPDGGAGDVVIVEPSLPTAVIVTCAPPITISLLTNSEFPAAVPA